MQWVYETNRWQIKAHKLKKAYIKIFSCNKKYSMKKRYTRLHAREKETETSGKENHRKIKHGKWNALPTKHKIFCGSLCTDTIHVMYLTERITLAIRCCFDTHITNRLKMNRILDGAVLQQQQQQQPTEQNASTSASWTNHAPSK